MLRLHNSDVYATSLRFPFRPLKNRLDLRRHFDYTSAVGLMSRSSRGLGHRPFTAATGVRIPYGMPVSPLKPSGFRGFFVAQIPGWAAAGSALTVVIDAAFGPVPQPVEVTFGRRIVSILEFGPVVAKLVVVQILDLSALQRRLDPQVGR